MNQYIEFYACAKAAYDTICEKIKQDLDAIPEYKVAEASMTTELMKTDEAEFDRLSGYVCELECSIEARHQKWEFYHSLDLAEKLLLDEFARFILQQKDLPEEVYRLFQTDTLNKIKRSQARRRELIDLILRSPDFLTYKPAALPEKRVA